MVVHNYSALTPTTEYLLRRYMEYILWWYVFTPPSHLRHVYLQRRYMEYILWWYLITSPSHLQKRRYSGNLEYILWRCSNFFAIALTMEGTWSTSHITNRRQQDVRATSTATSLRPTKIASNLLRRPIDLLQLSFDLLQLPFGLLQLPFDLMQLPFDLLQLPFDLLQLPLDLLQLPFGLLQLPFNLLQLPFDLLQLPFDLQQLPFDLLHLPLKPTNK